MKGALSNHGLRGLCERYEKILEMGDDGIVVTDERDRIEYVNTMACAITGLERTELYGKGIGIFLSPDSIDLIRDMERGITPDENRKVCTDVQIVSGSGNVKDCQVCIATARIDGKTKLYVYMRDITERKRMENQVRLSEEKYRHLFENIRHGIYTSSKEGKFIDCNQALVRMFGYENKNQFLALDISTHLYKNPGDRKAFQERIEKAGYVKDYEVTFKSRDGEDVEILLTSQTMRNERGEVIGYQGIMMDVTERKKMERNLREVNAFLNMLIDASPDGIIVTDGKGEIIMYNRAAERLLGYTRAEVLGKTNVKDLYPRGLARKIREMLMDDKTGDKGLLPPVELFVKNKKGDVLDISLSASVLYNEKEEEIGAIGIFKDLGEMMSVKRKLRETQDQLIQSERLAAMGRLTSQIAHEINNPLYGIMNTLELLKAEIPEASKRRKLLDMSLSEIARLSLMLKNMLTFSRPDQEARVEVSVNTFLESILMLMEKQLREADIKVVVQYDRDVPEVKVSPGQIRQVILNLVKNAIEAMANGGTLTVSTGMERNMVRITIQDTGVGMDGPVKEKIFDAFFTTKQQVRGVGLGLSVCYGIIQDHGGEIVVDSEPGKGSTFTILLPAVQYS